MFRNTKRLEEGGQTSSKGCGVIFGLGWTVFSSIFVAVGLWAMWGGLKSETWDEVPCKIERFEVVDAPDEDPPFRVDLVFRYMMDGSSYTGTKLMLDEEGSDSYAEMAEFEDRIDDGGEGVVCRVNPADPADAVLFGGGGDSWFGLVFVIFGGCFVVVGIGLILSAIRGGKAAKSSKSSSDREMGGVLGIGFFGVFAVAGLGILFGLVVPKAIEYFDAKGWVETPADVIWSRVRMESGDDGSTYRADVFYRYRFDGREYRSNRYRLMDGGSSGRKSKQEVVSTHPAGSEVLCFVNPDNPNDAVIERGIGWWALFALFPLPFAAIGLGGLYYTFIHKKKESKSGGGNNVENPKERKLRGTGSVLGRRILGVLGALAIAAFWNGITSVFVTDVVKGWMKGDGEWFSTLFMIPFVLIGIGLIIHVGYRLFAVFSPIYRVEFSERRMKPGARLNLSWRRRGGGGYPTRFSVWLVGREEATYRRGTDTVTSSEVFFEESVFETETRQMMPAGRATIDVPNDAVPTFYQKNNKIQWFIVLLADVPWRPDVKQVDEIELRAFEEGEVNS